MIEVHVPQTINKKEYELIFDPDFAKAFWEKYSFFEEIEFIPFYIIHEVTGEKYFNENHMKVYLKKEEVNCEILKELINYKYEDRNKHYYTENGIYRPIIENWEYHQHGMLNYAQEGKNPLKYLEKFLWLILILLIAGKKKDIRNLNVLNWSIKNLILYIINLYFLE